MADVTPILIKDLAAQTTLADTDYFIVGGADAKKITVAQMKEALGINALNTNSVGTDQVAFVTFSNYGDYWWISSPIPCLRADQLNVALSDNVKNTSVSVNSEISRGLFEVVRHKNTFYLRTNDQDVAGYIFKEVHPGVVWEVHYNVAG